MGEVVHIDGAPPTCPADEREILGGVLYKPSQIALVSELAPEHFYAGRHQLIWGAILADRDAGGAGGVDAIAVRLKADGRLEQVGGRAYLQELVDAVPVRLDRDLQAYAAKIVDTAERRALISAARVALARAEHGAEPTTAVRAALVEELQRASNDNGHARVAMLDGPALAAPLPELDYLVREIGLVAGGGAVHMVAGYGFSGKTMAAQSLALSLAAGKPVWGVYPCTKRRVVHVDLEQGDRLTRRRYQRLARAMGVDLADLGDALGVSIFPRVALTAEHRDGWKHLMAGRDLLILDSLRAATSGADENSSDIRAALDVLGSLSEETGCRVLVIHHARKPSNDAEGGRYAIRGSSAIYDALDCAYVFAAEKGEPISVGHVKARSVGEVSDDFALVISDVTIGEDPKGGLHVQVHGEELLTERRQERTAATQRDRARGDAEKVRQALRQQPGLGARALRGATGLSGDRLAAALETLGGAVQVREEANGKARTMRHYLTGSERS